MHPMFFTGSALAVGSAVALVSARTPKRAVFWLASLWFSFSVLFFVLGAGWVALVQAFAFGVTVALLFPGAARLLRQTEGQTRIRYFSISKLLGTFSVGALLLWILRSVLRDFSQGSSEGGDAVAIASILFAVGAAGAILRRHAFMLLLSLAVMVQSASLVFVAYSNRYGGVPELRAVLSVVAIVVAQSAVGLSLLQGVYRTRATLDLDELDVLRDEA